MSALPPHAIPARADDSAILNVLKGYIETLKAENDSLKRQLADAEKRVARFTALADQRRIPFGALLEQLLDEVRG
jgi:hypothetical protein